MSTPPAEGIPVHSVFVLWAGSWSLQCSMQERDDAGERVPAFGPERLFEQTGRMGHAVQDNGFRGHAARVQAPAELGDVVVEHFMLTCNVQRTDPSGAQFRFGQGLTVDE